jgi:hypothetical protein
MSGVSLNVAGWFTLLEPVAVFQAELEKLAKQGKPIYPYR